MAIVTINDEHLTNIASAIREKNGSTDTYKPVDMAAAIAAITTGGGGTGEPKLLTGDLSYLYSYYYATSTTDAAKDYKRRLMNVLLNFPDDTKDITTASNLGYKNTDITEFPYGFNVVDGCTFGYSFREMTALTKAPKINGKIGAMGYMFYGCTGLTDLSELEFYDLVQGEGTSSGMLFYNCYKIRQIPSNFLKQYGRRYNTTTSSSPGYNLLYQCYSLDEFLDYGVYPDATPHFSNVAFYVYHLKRWTFETNEDGTPIIANWAGATLDFSQYVGYASSFGTMLTQGFTGATRITDDATYQERKDNPDAWTSSVAYSRYDRASAVETINSLPDTSAYLASSGGTANTIKFKGSAGSSTDAGAINTMTEEEIAVAAAKGWTVTLA